MLVVITLQTDITMFRVRSFFFYGLRGMWMDEKDPYYLWRPSRRHELSFYLEQFTVVELIRSGEEELRFLNSNINKVR